MRVAVPWLAGAVLALSAVAAGAIDVQVSGAPWLKTLGAAQLEAGAGSDFASPVAEGESLTVLSISGTGGAAWNVQVALVGNPLEWPPGATLELRRVGGVGEAGIIDGLAYQTVTAEPQSFFSGTGNYDEVEILVRLSGFSVETGPGLYTIGIRFDVESI
jgi:hypothetical protein